MYLLVPTYNLPTYMYLPTNTYLWNLPTEPTYLPTTYLTTYQPTYGTYLPIIYLITYLL